MATRTLNFNPPEGMEQIPNPEAFGGYKDITSPGTNPNNPLAVYGRKTDQGGQQQQQNSPTDSFNLILMDILKKSQGLGSADLLKKKRALQRAQLGRAGAKTPEGLRTFSPEQQGAIRGGRVGALSGELDEINYEIAKANQATQNFERIFDQARQIGEDFQSKMVAPDDVIQSYKQLIEADPDNFNAIASKMNEKTLQEVIKNLDYSKLEPKEKKISISEQIAASKAGGKIKEGQFVPPGGVQIPESSRIAYVHNNPGNLMFAGQAGATQGEPKEGGGFWAKFESPGAGYSALIDQIELDKSRGLTLGEFISKYAPPNENQTLQYISEIGQMTGFGENAELTEVPTDLLAQAMAQKESGTTISEAGGKLNDQQELAARNLAVEIFGKRAGTKEKNIGLIRNMMVQGKSIDDIKDELRYSGQSQAFQGVYRDAAESIGFSLSENKQERFFDSLDRSLQDDNIDRAKEILIKSAIDTLGTEQANKTRGERRAVQLFDELENDLAEFENAGGNTNIFNGTASKMAEKVGAITDPELSRIANKIRMAIQAYRKAISGAAFTESESVEYKEVFPSINNVSALNIAKIQSAREVLKGNSEFILQSIMGAEAYNEIFADASGQNDLRNKYNY